MGRYALLIGNSEYQDTKLHQLLLPEADVSDLARILSDKSMGAFDEVQTLVNVYSYEARLKIAKFFKQRVNTDFLVLFFAGHGVKDRDGCLYMTFRDTDLDNLEGSALPDSFVASQMDRSRAESQLLLLDCCYSGAFGRDARAGLGTPVGIRETYSAVLDSVQGVGRIILTATDAIQFAWEGNQVWGIGTTNSLFTHALVQGIREGEADADGDGVITVDELYQYVHRTVRALDPDQEPQLFTRSGKHWGHLLISLNPKYVPSNGDNGNPLDREASPNPARGEHEAEIVKPSMALIPARVKVRDILPEPFEWCEIPQGSVDVEFSEDLKTAFQIRPFLMAKYPVTYAQFQVFLESEDGFTNDRWWQGLAVRHLWPGQQKWLEDNLPREHVSWYDAVAFCRWLSARLRYEVSLPTEWEWQWAAQGSERNNYPWGKVFANGRCNTEESGKGKTTPVDAYPAGASSFGVCDMSGNVWERCINCFGDVSHVNVHGSVLRGLRGGSWRYSQQYARTTHRHRCQPEKRYDDGGFRLVTTLR